MDFSMIDMAIDIIKDKASYTADERLHAMKFVLKQFEEKYTEVFEGLLTDDTEDLEVRSGAALALATAIGKMSVNILTAYTQSESPMLRKYVLEALGMTQDEKAVPLLINALSDDDNHVFFSASDALGNLGKKALPHLLTLLTEPGPDDARCVAAWKLGELGDADAVESLLAVLKTTENPELMALCIWALGEIGEFSDDVMSELSKAKTAELPEVSERAERALRKIARHVN